MAKFFAVDTYSLLCRDDTVTLKRFPRACSHTCFFFSFVGSVLSCFIMSGHSEHGSCRIQECVYVFVWLYEAPMALLHQWDYPAFGNECVESVLLLNIREHILISQHLPACSCPGKEYP